MSPTRAALDAAILAELRTRLAVLRGKSFDQLVSLPESRTEEASVLGKPVKFTVFREHQTDGSLLILVRSDKPIFFGIGSAGTTEGFFAKSDGEGRDAYGDEISEFFA
jgi:hypothetical protein